MIGKNTAERKFSSTGYRTHNYQVIIQTHSQLSHPCWLVLGWTQASLTKHAKTVEPDSVRRDLNVFAKRYRPMSACAVRTGWHGSILFAILKFSVCQMINLILFQTSRGFNLSAVEVFWKLCGKKGNCLLRAVSPFPRLFSTRLESFLPFSSTLKLSSANSLSLEESKICRLGKG